MESRDAAKAHRAPKAGRKAIKKKRARESDAIVENQNPTKKSKHDDPNRRNPKAFAIQSINKLNKSFRR